MRKSWTPTFGACATYTGADCATPATVRPDWKLPTPPTDEPGAWLPSVYHTGDSWLMEWRREDENDDAEYLMDGDAWPFVEDWAVTSDWTALGFYIA